MVSKEGGTLAVHFVVLVVVIVFEVVVVGGSQRIKFGQALVEPGAQSRAAGTTTDII